MADVTIRCVKCGEPVRVSEFVDVSGMKCAKCGEPLPPPIKTKRGPTPTVVRKLRQAGQQEEDREREKIEQKTRRVKRQGKKAKAKKTRRNRTTLLERMAMWQPTNAVGSWFLFITLGSALAWVRFGDVLTSGAMDETILYGKIIFALLYCVIIVEAFREETFEGMLCFFVPGYSFFYLFSKSDSFYLRALVGAFGVAFGYDTFIVLAEEASNFIDLGNTFIMSGGGDIK